MIPVRRLNHAVLYVRDAATSARWYADVFGFVIVTEVPGTAAFLRARATDNHHDLGLFTVGGHAPGPERGRVGLSHLAWQVDTVDDLVAAKAELVARGAYTGESDHGASKSLDGLDPDGNEFEIMWAVPPEAWGDAARAAVVRRLDLDAEMARFGGTPGRPDADSTP
ncbi:MAG: VOC family protein [Actinomycetota bacterium]